MTARRIDSKTGRHAFRVLWNVVETTEITLELVEMAGGEIGVRFAAQWSGLQTGALSGGPHLIAGNLEAPVHADPPIRLQITDWRHAPEVRRVSGRFRVLCDASVYSGLFGTVTLFDETLGGTLREAETRPAAQ